MPEQQVEVVEVYDAKLTVNFLLEEYAQDWLTLGHKPDFKEFDDLCPVGWQNHFTIEAGKIDLAHQEGQSVLIKDAYVSRVA